MYYRWSAAPKFGTFPLGDARHPEKPDNDQDKYWIAAQRGNRGRVR